MARLTDDERESLLADYHTGQFTQRQLSKRYGVSTATVNKLTKGVEPKHEHRVNTIATMKAELAEESEQERDAVHLAIEEKTKHLILFDSSALKNQKMANKALDSLEEGEREPTVDDLQDIEAHSRITQRNKDTVIGKEPITKIENVNAQQNNRVIRVEYS